ncbi:succinyl-CoA synthetase beta chain [Aspergillus heteromorphus CBS 117.55]|uniref:Succinyl-CoA synthetase beta chain n=1 Tax=Aspergillus heteromorphus CBS 117.55 TaxID=1448321 RepID=A0A317WRT6_9EURO|nr:succinyl-CoA synthetase beta chain [Aspergillus heteromorphus CBS 117.55]PWY89166.1 succinyl-CoA synthetase beta chain [Aspergillus heteromorphus CBS 117.55]
MLARSVTRACRLTACVPAPPGPGIWGRGDEPAQARCVVKQQIRRFGLLEYHSHDLLKQFNLPVPKGFVVASAEDARSVVAQINAPSVLKSQILAGGRGKGKMDSDGRGGVRIVNSADDAFHNASNMLNHYLTTTQTPPEGLLVQKLYIYRAVDVTHEFYVALTLDRSRGSPMLLISDQGGVNIESSIDSLNRYWFSPSTGIGDGALSDIQARLHFTDTDMVSVTHILRQAFRLFCAKDATLLELNPLVRTPERAFVCIDAKFEFDDSARFRQPEIFALEPPPSDRADEREAARHGLSYVRLEGNIGNLVNGAGLAMATNDLISHFGGSSANFLDIGGKATTETLIAAFKIVTSDPRVQGILVNIFGGIVRCNMIAESILAAADALGGLRVPVVVRLQGTNSEEALKMIRDSGLNLHTETDFEAAAREIVRQTPSYQ